MSESKEELPRDFMARVIYAWLLAILIYCYVTNSLVHQWEQPLLIFSEADNTYWLLHILNIPQTFMQSKPFSIAFDTLMVGSVIIFFGFPKKIIFCIISIVCLWLFQIMFGSSNGHHYAHVGFLILPIPFIFRQALKFYFAWELARYWILFLLLCAGLYKLYYGGFFHETEMAGYLRDRYNPDLGLKSKLLLYLIQHPVAAQLLYQVATMLELFSIIGFITHRYDHLILLSFLTFNLANLFFMRIPFWENSLIIAPFLPWKKLDVLFMNLDFTRLINGIRVYKK